MRYIYIKNFITRTVCLLLAAVFLSTLPKGMTALAFCLDRQQSHVVGTNLYLTDCHSASETGRIISNEHFSALTRKSNNDCTDISLANANVLNRSSRITLPTSPQVVLFYSLPSRFFNVQKQDAAASSSEFFRTLFVSPHLNSHRSIVLLV